MTFDDDPFLRAVEEKAARRHGRETEPLYVFDDVSPQEPDDHAAADR